MEDSLPGPETLVAHTAFLRRLARSLVLDPGQADDVVQDAMAVALRRPPRGRLHAFLAGVTRNLARKSLRGSARRARRERAAARPEALASAAEVAERLELQRAVAAAVHALEEPYRSAIVHRYYDDRTPTEIAKSLGVPVRTVETRLRRGIERLRAEMDATCGGDRRAWCLGLVPVFLAGRSRDLLAGGGVLLGATAMTTKAIGFGAALAATAFLAGWVMRPAPAPPRESTPRDFAATEQAFRAREAELQRELTSRDERIAALSGDNERLRAEATAAAAPAKHAGPATAESKGPRFVFGAHDEALRKIDWEAAGEALWRMGPLLEDLIVATNEGKPPPPSVGEIQRWNGPLVTVALTLEQNGVEGTETNGAFTHPSVVVNAVHVTLEKAGKPLTEEQEARLSEIGSRHVEEDRRRLAAYAPDALAARKLVDEVALKDRLFAEIDALVTDEQRTILHPPGTRGWTSFDLFSTGLVLGPQVRPISFSDRSSLAVVVAEWHARKLGLDPAQRPALDAATQTWAAALPEEFLAAEKPPLADQLIMRVDHATASARHAANLREALSSQLGLTAEQRKELGGMVEIPVPFRRKPG